MRKLPLAIGLLLLSFAPLLADEGHPVAIRHWPGGGFTIETMWGLSVGIDLNETAKESLPKAPDFEADTLKSEEHETLDRLPNKEAIQFGQTMPKGSTTGVFVNKGTVGQTMIEVDAVSLFHLNGMKPDDLRSLLKKAKPDFDDLENDPAVPRLYSVNVIATDPAFDEELIRLRCCDRKSWSLTPRWIRSAESRSKRLTTTLLPCRTTKRENGKHDMFRLGRSPIR